MRRFKVKFLTTIASLLAMIVTVLSVTIMNVSASGVTSVEISYKIYSYTDYNILTNFESIYGVDYDTLAADVETYDITYQAMIDDGMSESDAKDVADSYWSGSDVISINALVPNYSSYTTYTSTDYDNGWWNGLYALSGTLPTTTVKYLTPQGTSAALKNKKKTATTEIQGAGLSLSEARDALIAYESVSET